MSFFLVAALLVSFGLGFYLGEVEGISQGIKRISPSSDFDLSLFWETYNVLKEKFFQPQKLESQTILYGAISGMVNSLGDPYTTFLSPEDTKKFIQDVAGVFEGVGMEIGISKEQLQVIAPLEGSPAQRAGLRAGDRIIKIGDVFTQDMTLDKAVSLIRGPKGSEVALTIFREGWEGSKEFKITREVIEVPSLKWELREVDKENQIAYIRIYQFSEKAAADFRQAALEALDSPANKIILDLRNNPGGYLEVAQDIAGWFLERGQIVVVEDFGEGKEKKEYRAKGNGMFRSYPMVILIDQGSASGSEILAGALRDNRGIKLIGETSFGKGSVQELEMLKDESSLKVTVAKWLTPNGELITGVGLEPDIKIEMTDEDYENEREPQLDKALEVIKDL